MLRAEVNGLSVAYERTGGGPVLVLLHGFLLDARVWRPPPANLSARVFSRRRSARGRSLVLADTCAGWRGSLPEPIVEERLATCLRDASLPGSELVPRYLPGMFSGSATQ